MSQPSTLRDYVQLAAQVEDAVARIYDLFGTQFSANVEFSHFWRLSAEAERYHAATIRLHQAVLTDDCAVDETRLPVAVQETAEFLEDLQDKARACAAAPPTQSEAIEMALWIESHGSEVHGRTQFAFLHPTMAELFQRLEEEDRVHRRTFEVARQRFNGPGGRTNPA